MFLRLPSRSGGSRPVGPIRINYSSSLSVGLQSWIEPNANSFLQDAAPLGLVATTTSSPTLQPHPVGGSTLRVTGGSGFSLPPSGLGNINAVGFCTMRFVMTPVTWPGGFTAWMDDPGRLNSVFIDTSGNVSFDGNWLKSVNIANAGTNPLTAGLRWDIVVRGYNPLGGATSAYEDGWLNGVLTGTGGAGGNAAPDFSSVTESFGNNPSGSGSNADCQWESVQQWNRLLTDEEIWRLYDPPTRWDLYWTPSNRTFFHVPTVTTGKTFFLIPN